MFFQVLKKTIIGIGASLLFLVALFFVGVWWPLDKVVPVRTSSPIAIKNTSVIDLYSGEVLENQTVFIENKKIKFVGLSNKIDVSENAI